jgi:hypothetical protein
MKADCPEAMRLSMTKRQRKKHRPEEIVAKLRDADAMPNSGKDLASGLGLLQAFKISDTTLDVGRPGTTA